MSTFDKSFYTTDFDQEMMDFIEGNSGFKIEDEFLHWHDYHNILAYGAGRGAFWTESAALDVYRTSTPLTKQQFKEKIGMPMESPVTEETTFGKKDLVDGMFVKCRNGEIHVVLGDIACDDSGFLDLEQEYDEEMLYLGASEDFEEFDIMEVFVKYSNLPLHEYLSGEGLKSIWKRTPPKSEKVIKLEKLIRMHEEQLEATKKLLAEELSL